MIETPKSMQPPEVKGTSDGITGWEEFERWATHNLKIWNSARHYCAMVGMRHTEYLKLVAYHLTLENKQMKDDAVKRLQEGTHHDADWTGSGRPIR